MTLEERLKQLPQRLNYANTPHDWWLEDQLDTCRGVLDILIEDLKENEPYARDVIRDLEDTLSHIPDDMEVVREIDKGRGEG